MTHDSRKADQDEFAKWKFVWNNRTTLQKKREEDGIGLQKNAKRIF